MSDNTHAFLPPSGASAWSKCALWATMNRLYPQESSPEAEEGTAAHWVGTELFAGRFQPEGTSTPNNLIVTEEMVDGAELLIDTVKAQMDGIAVHVEERVSIPVHEDCFGTPDYWGTTGHTKHIKIVDYKFGHRFVDEFFNPQGLLYLAGIIQKLFGQVLTLDPEITVSFTIVQPRCFYKGSAVRTHTFKLLECQPYMKHLKFMADISMVENPVATTNPECGFCPGRHACSALQQAAYSDAEFATDRVPLALSPEAAGLELRMLSRALERLTARVDGLREQTLANIKAGARVPHYHIEQGNGRSQWKGSDEQILSIGQLFGVDLSKPGLITPNQAKKKGVDESVISAYSFVPTSGLKLVADNPADVRKVFG